MDKLKLEYEMKKAGVTRAELSEHLGISPTTFYRKCEGISEFTLSEIQKIVEYLNLESPVDIFFPKKVS